MGRTIITSCGTSLLSSGCWDLPGEVVSLLGLSENDVQVQKATNKSAIAQKDRSDLVNKFDQNAWNMNRLIDLPAELATLKVYSKVLSSRDPAEHLGKGDKVMLLHSSNEEGAYCADVLERVLPVLFRNIEVSSMRINNLDPVDLQDFGKALTEIWKECSTIINAEHNCGNKIIFNLTGGYKAVVMVLAALCAANPAIPVSIVYLHETAISSGSLFAMNFQGPTIPNKLQPDYLDARNPEGIRGIVLAGI